MTAEKLDYSTALEQDDVDDQPEQPNPETDALRDNSTRQEQQQARGAAEEHPAEDRRQVNWDFDQANTAMAKAMIDDYGQWGVKNLWSPEENWSDQENAAAATVYAINARHDRYEDNDCIK